MAATSAACRHDERLGMSADFSKPLSKCRPCRDPVDLADALTALKEQQVTADAGETPPHRIAPPAPDQSSGN